MTRLHEPQLRSGVPHLRDYLLGTDEAGYGPNLGPLVVASTLWSQPGGETDSLDDQLRKHHLVTSSPRRTTEIGSPLPLVIADSKTLYRGQRNGSPLESLGKTVRMVLQSLGHSPKNPLELLTYVAADTLSDFTKFPWDVFLSEPFDHITTTDTPDTVVITDVTDITSGTNTAAQWSQKMAQHSLAVCGLSCRIASPQRFNEEVEKLGSKGSFLSLETLHLVRESLKTILSRHDAHRFVVFCDKHGGRNRYSDVIWPFLADFIDPSSFQTVSEERSCSLYRFRSADVPVEIYFQAKGETHIPTAMASMTAKLVRELMMMSWNMFWRQYLPDLQPTAGYPVDARRFFQEIQSTAAVLQIPTDWIWRLR